MAATAKHRRLLYPDNSPVVAARFWFDEKPLPMHPATPPEGAPTTRSDGTFRLEPLPENMGDGDWLWFAINEGACLAIPRQRLPEHDDETVFVPRHKTVTVVIRSLPADEAWQIAVQPVWVEADGDMRVGPRSVEKAPRPAVPGAYVLRRHVDRRGLRGPARVEFRVLVGMPCAFVCYSPGYEVEPDVQEFKAPPRTVVAHATAHRSLATHALLRIFAGHVFRCRAPCRRRDRGKNCRPACCRRRR